MFWIQSVQQGRIQKYLNFIHPNLILFHLNYPTLSLLLIVSQQWVPIIVYHELVCTVKCFRNEHGFRRLLN